MFKTAALSGDSTVDLEENAAAVILAHALRTLFPQNAVKSYPNNKPWISCEVRAMLHACYTAFISGDAEDYKKARYNLSKSIRQAKRQFRLRLEGYYTTADSQCMYSDHDP